MSPVGTFLSSCSQTGHLARWSPLLGAWPALLSAPLSKTLRPGVRVAPGTAPSSASVLPQLAGLRPGGCPPPGGSRATWAGRCRAAAAPQAHAALTGLGGTACPWARAGSASRLAAAAALGTPECRSPVGVSPPCIGRAWGSVPHLCGSGELHPQRRCPQAGLLPTLLCLCM